MARKKKTHPGQLDLFVDSGAILSANAAADALLRHDPERAEECLRKLENEEPGYRALGALRTLCRTLREWPWAASNPAEVAAALLRLETEIEPAALAALGGNTPDFMRPFWRELAGYAEPHGYDPALPQAFSAGLHLRAQDGAAAVRAVESIPNHEGNPDALHWLALARHGLGGLEAGRPFLLRLALLAPERLVPLIGELGDPVLGRDWKAFQADFGGLDGDEGTAAWFPAWYVLVHPATPVLSDAALPATPAAQGLAAIERLNALEGLEPGPELIAVRSRLRTLAPELFALYMARHESGSGRPA